ncbi:Retrovirus-related Pol polyprotein from transposon 412, partial [Araneus ventricosus]
MAFLAKHRKEELIALADDMGIEISTNDKKIDICKKVEDFPDFEEEFVRGCLEEIVRQREELKAQAEAAELKAKAEAAELKAQAEAAELKAHAEAAELKRIESLRQEREFELEKMRISNAAEVSSVASTRSENSKNRLSLKNLMQKFDAQVSDISMYLALFERHARTAGIEETEWVPQRISLLPLDLAQIIIKEPEEKMQDYLNVKEVLLDRFKMKPETFRLKFTQHQKKTGALWRELVFQLRNYLDGWLDGLEVRDFENLKNLMISDQIKRRVAGEVKEHFLDEWGKLVDPLVLAGKIDEYESVRSSRKLYNVRMPERKPLEKVKLPSPRKENKSKFVGKSEHQFWKNSTPKGNWRNENFERRKPAACYICHSTEHLRPNCPQLRKDKPAEVVNHVGMSDSTENLFAPYMSKALVNQTEMSILRDTGASIDLVSRNHINSEDLPGETVWIKQPLDKNFTCLSLAKIELQSLVFGKIITKAAVIDASLDNGIYLLGNRSAQLIEEQRKTPTLNAVVTRSQKLKKETEASAVLKPPPQRPSPTVLDENPSIIVAEELVPFPLPQAEGDTNRLLKVDSEAFASEQRNCTGLKPCWEKEREGKGEFVKKGDLLFRKNKDHFGNEYLQLVIPADLRNEILALCHESTSAHLGVTKTKDRLLRHYFWPNCVKDTENYVRSCDPCQRIGKAREKGKAPLKLVPILTEIFSKINIDAVGPLPISAKNNRYLLTAICMSSKYPETIPVADINSVSVIDALLEVFSTMGFPREIQCDNGTSFTSQLTTEFFERFGIKVTHSSVHHPQSNPVERFHRTLKRLLKVLCLQSGEDWKKNLPATLLALRTVTHESTGFSPAELVHGKNLRTPEVLLYEHWVNPQESESSVTEYVFELINRMRRCQDLAVERMTEVQVKRKTWYDKNAVRRKFQVGDQVLVLATSKPNKMAVQWTGPGVIESQLSDTNYIVKMANKNDKTQIYHVNLLKPYHQRPEKINLLISERKETPEAESDELGIPYSTADPNVYDFEEIIRD